MKTKLLIAAAVAALSLGSGGANASVLSFDAKSAPQGTDTAVQPAYFYHGHGHYYYHHYYRYNHHCYWNHHGFRICY